MGRSTHDSLPQVAIAIVIAVFVLLHSWEFANKSFGANYYDFWVVGQELNAHHANQIYSPAWRRDAGEKYWRIAHSNQATQNQLVASDARRVIQTDATPLVYSTIALISSSDYGHSLQIFRIIQFSYGIIAIAILCRLLGFSWTATLLAIAALWGWGEAYVGDRGDLFVADISQIQLFMIALVCWIEMRWRTRLGDYLAGMVIAKIVLLQPQLFAIPVLLATLWLASHQTGRTIRHGIGFLIAAALLLRFSSLRFGSFHCWIDWFSAIHELTKQHPLTSAGNCSLAQIIREHLGTAPSILFTAATRAGVLILVGWLGRRKSDEIQTYIVLSLACALPLLVWPIVWQQDFVLAVPALLLALQPSGENESRDKLILRWSLAAIALLMFSSSPLTSTILWLDDPQSIAARLAGATLVVFCLAIAKFTSTSISIAPASDSANPET